MEKIIESSLLSLYHTILPYPPPQLSPPFSSSTSLLNPNFITATTNSPFYLVLFSLFFLSVSAHILFNRFPLFSSGLSSVSSKVGQAPLLNWRLVSLVFHH